MRAGYRLFRLLYSQLIGPSTYAIQFYAVRYLYFINVITVLIKSAAIVVLQQQHT